MNHFAAVNPGVSDVNINRLRMECKMKPILHRQKHGLQKKTSFESFRKQNGYGTYDWTFFAWAVAEVDYMFKLFLHWYNPARQKKNKMTTYGM